MPGAGRVFLLHARGRAVNDCVFSPCRTWRYELWVRWLSARPREYCMFIGLNPSTADEYQLDPTLRKCVGFAKRWGDGAMVMTNLFAYRATLPEDMKKAHIDPVGPDNDATLIRLARGAKIVVAAWG